MKVIAARRSSGGAGIRKSSWILALVACLSLVGLLILVLPSRSEAGDAKVVRIIAGDTVVVQYKSVERHIRLLNVDTPGTGTPNGSDGCMGSQATRELRRLLPAGTKVRLKFDGQHRDRYGRDLAAVFLPDGRFVSAEIARAGLGNPADSDSSTSHLPEVTAAQAEAYKTKRGLFDPTEKCTVAGRTRAIEVRIQKASATKPETVAEAKAVTAELASALAEAKAFDKLIASAPESPSWQAYSGNRMTILADSVSVLIDDGIDSQTAVLATEEELVTSEAGTTSTGSDSTPSTGTTSSPSTGGSTTTPPSGHRGKQCNARGGSHSKKC